MYVNCDEFPVADLAKLAIVATRSGDGKQIELL